MRGVDLDVGRGEIFAFLGPNGAGKTTTVEILEGFQTPDEGEVLVLGERPDRAGGGWRERVGIVLQESPGEVELTVGECMDFYAGLYSAPRSPAETLELVGLEAHRDQLANTLSGGQRRRLDVALALIGDPELLFLDEPTTGFDPAARRDAWRMLDGLRELGKTIFLTTHYMEEAERLADRIAVIAAGRIVDVGTAAGIGNRDGAGSEITFTLSPGLAIAELPPELLAKLEAAPQGGQVLLRSFDPLIDLRALGSWLEARGGRIADLEVRRPTLEDIYLQLTTPTGEESS